MCTGADDRDVFTRSGGRPPFVGPVLLLIVIGIIEFGSIYSNVLSMRHGIREAGRQGSVANFGSTTNCGLNLSGSPSTGIQKLLCLAKHQASAGNGVKPKVRFADADLTGPPTRIPACIRSAMRS